MDSISTTELPSGQGNPENSEFKKVLEESKRNIHEASAAKDRKRGRGRPPKKRSEAPSPTNTAPQVSEQPIQPAPDVSGYLKDPLMFISKIPAAKHGRPELALTDDEAKACAEGLNGVLQAFVPDVGTMDPKTASVVGLLAVVGSIGVQKYMIFNSKKPKPEDTPKSEPQTITQPSAGEYFGVVRA